MRIRPAPRPATGGGFLQIFLRGKVDGYGPWHEHVLDGLAASRRGDGPFLVMHYEQLRADPASELARVLEFLGASRDPADLQAVVGANSKDRMHTKEATREVLATQRTDGSTFVRADRDSDWVRDVPLGENGRRALGYGAPSKAAVLLCSSEVGPELLPLPPTCPLPSTGVESRSGHTDRSPKSCWRLDGRRPGRDLGDP